MSQATFTRVDKERLDRLAGALRGPRDDRAALLSELKALRAEVSTLAGLIDAILRRVDALEAP